MALYVGEVIVAIFLIVIFLLVVFVPEEVKIEADLKETGLKVLRILDQNNELRRYVVENDTNSIKNKLSSLLPYQISYEVFICDYSCPSLNLEEEKITSVSYLLAGDVGKFEPKEVILWLW